MDSNVVIVSFQKILVVKIQAKVSLELASGWLFFARNRFMFGRGSCMPKRVSQYR